MAWYYGTYSCGHEGRVNLIGPTKHREWKKERHFENVCEECFKERAEKENKKALEESKEMELPELNGSEKQVSWANTIRIKVLKSFEHSEKIEYSDDNFKKQTIESSILIDYLINNKLNASWWIDVRSGINKLEIVKEIQVNNCKQEETILIKDIQAEATVSPDNKITNAVVEIKTEDNYIKVFFEKNDKFKEIVKGLNYTWGSGYWYREICETTGTIEDRTTELGNKLLNAGFPIMIFDETIRKNAIEGNYKEECNRWIFARISGKYEGRLAIKWAERNDKLYKVSRSLPGSIWDSATIVKIEHYKEIEEFADMYGFQFTKNALKLIEQQKEKETKISIVNPTKVENKKEKDGLNEILESGDEILDDLKD